MRTVAAGNLIKLVYLILGLAAVLFVVSWYPQFSQGYEIQNQARLACNDAIKIARYGAATAKDPSPAFVAGATRAGVHLKPDDYSFVVEHDRPNKLWTCAVKVHYPVDAEVNTIGPILDIKPVHFTKKISFVHEVPDSY
ncbi:MAG TPA: hypothetical protein VGO62_11920 [Myxococcota bacterium]|jgi:hypothetical protein